MGHGTTRPRAHPDASQGLPKNKPQGGKLLMRTRAAWGYGATVARLTPDQKVGSSNLSGLKAVREEKCDG